jgi:hypothetical protein
MAEADANGAQGSYVFASVSMHMRDKVRFLQFPANMQPKFREVIRRGWPQGIQAEKTYAQAYEYKLKGTPFGSITEKDDVAACRLLRNILAFLYARGWRLDTAITHQHRVGAKDNLIFRREEGHGKEKDEGDDVGELGGSMAPPPVDWLVLSMCRVDSLRIICDGPYDVVDSVTTTNSSRKSNNNNNKDDDDDDYDDSSVISKDDGTQECIRSIGDASRMPGNPAELGTLVTTVKDVLAGQGFFRGGKWSHDSYEFKLKGTPWVAMGEETMRVRLMLLELVAAIDRLGWRSYASVHLYETRMVDTWYFVRPSDWVPGSPFNAGVPVSLLDM